MSKNKKISNCSKSYSDDYLLRYLNDELSDADSAILEDHLQECDVCSDHLDGLLMMEDPSEIAVVAADLNSIIDKKAKTKRRVLGMEPSTFRAIAAIFLLLTISGTYIIIDNLIDNNKITELEGISNVEEEATQQKTLRDLENDLPGEKEEPETMVADLKEVDEEESSISEYKSLEQSFEEEELFEVYEDVDANVVEELYFSDDSEILDEKVELENNISANGTAQSETISTKDMASDGFIDDINDQDRTIGGAYGNIETTDEIATVTSAERESKSSFWRFGRDKNKRESSVAMEASKKQEYNDKPDNSAATGSANTPKETNSRTNSDNSPVKTNGITVEDSEDERDEGLLSETDIVLITDVNEEVVDDDNANIVFDLAEVEENSDEPLAFAIVEEKPQYPGGDTAMFKFISNNFQMPEVQEGQVGGKIFVQFVIESTGEVNNVKIAKGIDPYLDQEALRVIRSMPNWIPGKQRGKAVPVSFIVPINIELK